MFPLRGHYNGLGK